MKVKEFKKTEKFRNADIIKYYESDGTETEFSNIELNNKKFDNKEIIGEACSNKCGLIIVELVLE